MYEMREERENTGWRISHATSERGKEPKKVGPT
jgi:hypothetical protein